MARLSETDFVLVDTETSGLDPTQHELLEVAAIQCRTSGPEWVQLQTLVRPTKPIPASASAIHHLVASDFTDAMYASEAKECLETVVPDNAVIVAHHAQFDRDFIAPALAGRRWICTERLAHHLLPEAENFKNATLYYHLGGEKIRFQLHGAAADLLVTKFVFRTLIERYLAAGHPDDVDGLIAFAAAPYLLQKFAFGKYRGKRFDEANPGYLAWMLSPNGMPNMDPDLRHTVITALNARQKVGVAS